MSASLVGTIRGIFACANLNAGGFPSLTNSRGFSGVALNGPGDYTLETQNGLNLLPDGGGLAFVSILGSVPGLSSTEQVDATHLRVRTTDSAGVPLDANFSIYIQDIGPV